MVFGLCDASGSIGDLYVTRVDNADFLAPLAVKLTENLEAMLAGGEYNATIRLALGYAKLKDKENDKSVEYLSVAVDLDPDYSAAWKLLGKAQTEAGLRADAIETYRRGIEVATRRGDRQAVREMQVFLQRLDKTD